MSDFDVVDALAGFAEDLKGEAAFAERLHGAVVTLKRERDAARADLLAVAEALGCVSTDDTGRIGAVASFREILDCAVEAVRKANRCDEFEEALSFACENPPPRCECPGCSYAREKGGAA